MKLLLTLGCNPDEARDDPYNNETGRTAISVLRRQRSASDVLEVENLLNLFTGRPPHPMLFPNHTPAAEEVEAPVLHYK